MLKTVLLVISGIVILTLAVILVLAAMKPDTFRVERSVTIHAGPEKIYPLIADYHAWRAWSPFETDPAMQRSYGGAESGAGAVYEWDGKGVGSGRMETLEASTARIVIKLDFFKPFRTTNKASFTLEPQGADTKVTWVMEGPVTFLPKIMHVVFNMDKMVGGEFDKGLAKLKAVAEK
ncbi:MAG TPA: SRPBCC family protein [Parvibaculum sp.]|jgi:hypothetical protein